MGTNRPFSSREVAKISNPLRRYNLATLTYITTREICELCRCGYKKALTIKMHLLAVHTTNDRYATLNNGISIRTRYVLEHFDIDKDALMSDALNYAKLLAITTHSQHSPSPPSS